MNNRERTHRAALSHAVIGHRASAVTLLDRKMGGSNAQRDVVDWTLAEAAARAGQRDIALSMAHERLATRPRSVPNRHFLQKATAIAA